MKQLVLDEPPQQQQGDSQGPASQAQQQEVADAIANTLTVTAEQAAILERCAARQEAVRPKWTHHMPEGGGLPPPDVLKRLCRKVRHRW